MKFIAFVPALLIAQVACLFGPGYAALGSLFSYSHPQYQLLDNSPFSFNFNHMADGSLFGSPKAVGSSFNKVSSSGQALASGKSVFSASLD
jgi:hypothetical protein